MGKTKIRWASHTWNPSTASCIKVSPGCAHCYAERLVTAHGGTFRGAPELKPNWQQVLNRVPDGAICFVNSMTDSFHEGASLPMIMTIFQAAVSRRSVKFLFLTKRIKRAFELRMQLPWPDNIWLGTSVENADYLWRLDYLTKIPAAGRFVSVEPLLGPLPGLAYYMDKLDWVIVGGESGPAHRPLDLAWVRGIRDQCRIASVPFLYKQGSAFWPEQDRELDGRTWDETPWNREPAPEQLSLF